RRMTLPAANEWGAIIDAPSNAPGGGTVITPGNLSYSEYSQVVSSSRWGSAGDAYAIQIWISSIGVTTLAKDALLTIGIDTDGGSNYVDFISDLLVSCADSIANGGGVTYYFPVHVPAGSTLAA